MLRQEHYRPDPPLQAMADDLHTQLDVPALAAAWAEGRALTMEEAVQYLLAEVLD